MLDKAKIAELEALLAKATPGPWLVRDDNEGDCWPPRPLWCVENEAMHTGGDDDPAFHAAIHYGGKCDAELISAMHEALPALLRLARAVVDAHQGTVSQVEWEDSDRIIPHIDKDEGDVLTWQDIAQGQRVLLLRADAADTTAGEGGNG